MKTLVAPKHDPTPRVNGFDGCHARIPFDAGTCPGVETARWLNGLGEDDDTYLHIAWRRVTNGDVRDNWLRSGSHIVAVDPALASLRERERRARRDLSYLRREVKRLEKTRADAR